MKHLAKKHLNTHGMPKELQYHGLSDIFFAKEEDESEKQMRRAIHSVTEQLSGICMHEESGQLVEDAINNLMEKIRDLNIEEAAVKYSTGKQG